MKLVEHLVNAIGPSGAEQQVRAIIMKAIKPHVDKVYIDKFGNLIAHKKGKGPKVMLAAHMDEIGLMVKSISDEGWIHVAKVGGFENITITGQAVHLFNGSKVLCKGILTTESLHEDYDIEEIPTLSELYIDTGLTKEELIKRGVGIGTYAVPMHHFKQLGNKTTISGKALDDRLGCYVLIEVAKQLKKSHQDIYFVFTVQEEIGMYGAQTAVYKIDPDWGIAMDTTSTEDSRVDVVTQIGNGPVISIMDSEIISNVCLNSWLTETAKKKKIPVQMKVEEAGTFDATRIMLSKGGIPSTIVAIPVRNLHSTVGVANIDDIQNSIKLLVNLLKEKKAICVV